jgi:hypothetical protein
MTTAENIALIAESDTHQYKLMVARAERESVALEFDEYEAHPVTDYIFSDGSKLRKCAGHMEAV